MILFKVAVRVAALVAVCASVSACASLVGEGSSQNIAIMTNPGGATCVLMRNGEMIGKVETPGNIMVKRRKYDIDVKCNKPGYFETEYVNHSGLSSMVAGNVTADLLLTGGLSSIIDSANGADNEYTPTVILSLNPNGGPQTVAAVQSATTLVPQSASQSGDQRLAPSDSGKVCSHDELVQARIARMNGYTGGPNCSNNL
jgi:hypothetical protein